MPRHQAPEDTMTQPADHPPHPGEPAADPRPTMTERELSWHKNVAGIRAGAEHDGLDPRATDALLDAAAGPLELRPGLTLQPVSLGTLKTLEKLNSAFLAEEAVALDADQITLAILCFAEPREVWTRLRDDRRPDILTAAEDLAFTLTLPQLRQAGEWINHQLLILNQLTGDGHDHTPPADTQGPLGKPAASSEPARSEAPPSTGASPSSTSSPPPTDSASPTPPFRFP